MEQSIEFLKRYTDEIDRGFQGLMDEIAYEAKQQENIKTAKKMLSKGFSIYEVQDITNLPIKKIQELQNKSKRN